MTQEAFILDRREQEAELSTRKARQSYRRSIIDDPTARAWRLRLFMALTSWKAFQFFSKTELPVPADEDGGYPFDVRIAPRRSSNTSLTRLCFQNGLVSIATGAESLFLGDSSGNVRILSRAFKVIRSFRAADSAAASIVQLEQVPNTSFIITIAQDLSNDPVLKVWALDKIEKKTGGPKCLCSVGIQNGKRQFPVQTFSMHEEYLETDWRRYRRSLRLKTLARLRSASPMDQ
jgi:hypothetical protein